MTQKHNIVDLAGFCKAGAYFSRTFIIVTVISFLFLLLISKIVYNTVIFLDYSMYDILISNNLVQPSQKIVAVIIDDDSIKGKDKYPGLGRWPWPRTVHANLIKKLLNAGAKVIGFDIYFARKTNPKEDNILVETIRQAKGSVVIAHLETFSAESLNFASDIQKGSIEPVKIGGGEGNIIRSIYFKTYNGEIRSEDPFPYPLSYKIAQKMLDANTTPHWDGRNTISDGTVKIPVEKINEAQTEPDIRFFFPFSEQMYKEQRLGSKGSLEGNILSAYDYHSYIDVLNGNFNKDFFRGKAVIVYSDFNIHDKFPVPGVEMFNGGEIHANALQAVLDNKFIVHNTRAEQIILVLVFASSLILLLVVNKWHWRLILLTAIATLTYIVHYYMFKFYYQWIKIIIPLFAIPLNWMVIYSYEHRKIKGLLARFVPKRVYDILIKSEKTVEAGHEIEEATILFSDIRGYTTLSESMGPEELSSFMREYHKVMEEVVEQFMGEVMYYQGDAQMVAFRHDKRWPNFTERGIGAGIMMQERLASLNDDRVARGRSPIQIGVGITTGEVAFGMVGEDRLSYTALGDVVNTAARLQGLSLELSAQVLIDSRTCELTKDTINVEKLKLVKLKGKSKLVQAYKVLGCVSADFLQRNFSGKSAH